MAPKTLMFLLGTLLFVATKVSSYQKEDDEIMSSFPLAPAPAASVKPPTKAPVEAPVPSKPPTPAPPVKPPTHPIKPPTPAPPAKPPTQPIKPPAAAPPAKPPTHTIKPPTPAPSPVPVPGHPITKKDCIPLCEQRCKLHASKRKCVRACSACCDKCKCVPPGTDGNREMCGKCYTETRTHGHIYQCP
ncbi:hypothetical protein SLA2020_079090 [Shorea laevis]